MSFVNFCLQNENSITLLGVNFSFIEKGKLMGAINGLYLNCFASLQEHDIPSPSMKLEIFF